MRLMAHTTSIFLSAARHREHEIAPVKRILFALGLWQYMGNLIPEKGRWIIYGILGGTSRIRERKLFKLKRRISSRRAPRLAYRRTLKGTERAPGKGSSSTEQMSFEGKQTCAVYVHYLPFSLSGVFHCVFVVFAIVQRDCFGAFDFGWKHQ